MLQLRATDFMFYGDFSITRAAGARRNRRAVRASCGMTQEGADFIRSARREDVLELTSLLLDFAFAVHGEAVGEQALGEAMAADNADGAFAAPACEFDDLTAVAE